MKMTLSAETPIAVRRRSRVRAVIVAAHAFTLACSGAIDGNDPAPGDVTPAGGTGGSAEPGATITQEQPTTTNPGGSGANPPGTGTGNAPPELDPFDTVLGREVKAILEANCAGCHQAPAKSGGIDFILDLNAMVDNQKLVPGQKDESSIYVRMFQQSMPPANVQERRPTFSQIDLVGRFIDELPPLAADRCEPLPFVSTDELIRAMAEDVAGLDDEDALFTRYLTLTYNSNAGGCGRELDRQRFALFKTINSVSTNPVIKRLQAIDESDLIYRVDIRDFNWDRAIDLEDDGTLDFDDAWLAIVDTVNDATVTKGAFAPEFAGDDADALKEDTGTAVPFMPVNAFVQAVEQGDLYYALIGARANLFVFEREVLRIDTVQELADNNVMRAGFTNSGVSKQERVLNRFDSGVSSNQAYWISFDFDGGNGAGERDVANESIYADPLGFQFAGGEAIFNLPNGLQAYYVADAQGDRLSEAPVGVVIDPAQNNGTVVNGASCNSCHNAGMIAFQDQVRSYVERNKTLFNNQTYEDVMKNYPDFATFKAKMDEDSKRHTDALVRAGVPLGSLDAVSTVFIEFQNRNIAARHAAAELGVRTEELLDNLPRLSTELQPLADEGGFVNREIFGENFFDSLCRMHVSSENQPVGCP